MLAEVMSGLVWTNCREVFGGDQAWFGIYAPWYILSMYLREEKEEKISEKFVCRSRHHNLYINVTVTKSAAPTFRIRRHRICNTKDWDFGTTLIMEGLWGWNIIIVYHELHLIIIRPPKHLHINIIKTILGITRKLTCKPTKDKLP